MSETRYTPEQMREWADSPNSSHSTAAMLRQAATDAEALAAKEQEIARLMDQLAKTEEERREWRKRSAF